LGRIDCKGERVFSAGRIASDWLVPYILGSSPVFFDYIFYIFILDNYRGVDESCARFNYNIAEALGC
jgi:hypothetical protein